MFVCVAGDATGTAYSFHDYDGMVAELEQLAADHPGLAELQTAQDLFGLPSIPDGADELLTYIFRITDESTGLDKPEVLMVRVQHGNEVVGVEVLLALARLLLESYGTDPWLTYLVDHREIYLVPMANPWGFRHGVRSGPGGEGSEDMNRDHIYDRRTFDCQGGDVSSSSGSLLMDDFFSRHDQ